MRVTAAGIIGIPTVLFPKLEKLVNVVQTLIAVQDGRIELKARDSTIALTAKLCATIQLPITVTTGSLDLDPILALTTYTGIGSKRKVKSLRTPPFDTTATSIEVTVIAESLPIIATGALMWPVVMPSRVSTQDFPAIFAKAELPVEALQADPVQDRELMFPLVPITLIAAVKSLLLYCGGSRHVLTLRFVLSPTTLRAERS
jgi:hypothetical protein